MLTALMLVLNAGLAQQPNVSSNGLSPEIDGILTRLEKKGDDIHDLRCKLQYRIDDKVNLDMLTKYGTIRFKRAQPHDVFLINFDRLIQDEQETKMKEWYLFKDRWLWEAKERSKTIIKREVVAEGEKIDLFDVETAPFPVPFGQKKEHINKTFVVSLVPPAAGDPENADHLVCVPKPGTNLAHDFSRLEFWVSRASNLPVRIVSTEVNDEAKVIRITTATFEGVEIDAGLGDKDFANPPDWKNYTVNTEPLAKPEPPPGK